MGNRGNVIFTDGEKSHSVNVYLHWNGGPESIYGFLEELDRRKIRADQDYEAARFIQLIGEFFDQDGIGGLSLGVSNGPKKITVEDLKKVFTDPGDNGFYVVNRTGNKTTVRRFIRHYQEQENGRYKEYIEEMDELSVAREKKEADAHKYREEFRNFFQGVTKDKQIEAN